MRSVLGIDAAWTTTQPSGVALAQETDLGWELLAVAASYQQFHSRADEALAAEIRPLGSVPDASALLKTCASLSGKRLNMIAIDMPLSTTPILGRRSSDNAVSRAWGSRKCGTHTPSAVRPGAISDNLRLAFHHEGYPLLTDNARPPGVIEVYPHPALVMLTGADERLAYKTSKAGKYWPSLTPSERKIRLFAEWDRIVDSLDCKISGVRAALPAPPLTASTGELKAYEDAIDAVVCAWVAICVLNGDAVPYGDQCSAIWIPSNA